MAKTIFGGNQRSNEFSFLIWKQRQRSMISIIVSSYKKELFLNFKRSVEETIGDVPYEIIQIQNPGLMSISAAYNKGGSEAKFDYLVFSHEDILFHTPYWGKILVDIFEKDSTIGLLGVAGSFYKAMYYSGWSLQPSASSTFMIGSHYGKSNLAKIKCGISREIVLDAKKTIPVNFIESEIFNEEVVVLDGMFLATQKRIFNEIKFDGSSFTGFHCYDLDYSLQVRGKYKVVVNQNILVEHLSTGTFEKDWIKYIKIFTRKWIQQLPTTNRRYSNYEKAELEFNAYEQFLRIARTSDGSLLESFAFLFSRKYIGRIGFVSWYLINYKIMKKFLRLLLNRRFT